MEKVFIELSPVPQEATAKLHALMLKFYTVMAADPLLHHFFTGRDLAAIAAKQSEFILRAMGAVASYSGKPPATAHKELPSILSGHFNRRLVLLRNLLTKEGFSPPAVDTWIAFEQAFFDAVVTTEKPR